MEDVRLKNSLERERTTIFRAISAVFLMLLAGYLNSASQVLVERISDPFQEDRVLFDIGFLLTGNGMVNKHWSIDVSSGVTFIITLIVLWYSVGILPSIYFVRIFIIQALLFLTRAVAISVTILPKPLTDCETTIQPKNSILYEAFLITLGIHRTCADVFFSGHAANLVLSLCAWIYYIKLPPRRFLYYPYRVTRCVCFNFVLRLIVYVFIIFSTILLIVSRFHYTIDVIFGILLAILYFLVWEYLVPLVIVNQ